MTFYSHHPAIAINNHYCPRKCVLLLMVIKFVVKQNNHKGLNPANGISPIFYPFKKSFIGQ